MKGLYYLSHATKLFEFFPGWAEISNHLGNVLTVINDKKDGQLDSTASLNYYGYYTPQIVSAADYYPFGWVSRNFQSNAYRYGFNGKERDDAVKGGEGTQLDYGMRIYDPRVGRFLSVDPITRSFPMLTPYQFAENQPIWAVDLDGLEKQVVTYYYNKNKEPEQIVITVINDKKTKQFVNMDLHHNGIKKWKQDVLIRNVYTNGKTTYDHAPKLTDYQNKVFNSSKVEINTQPFEKFGVDFGGRGPGDDGSELLTTAKEDFTQDRYLVETRQKLIQNFSSFSSKTLFARDDKDEKPAKSAGQIIEGLNSEIEGFKKNNPQAEEVKGSITLIANNADSEKNANKVAGELRKNNYNVTVKKDEKAIISKDPLGQNSKYDFKVYLEVKGHN
jgi:RHS repeat-associated protein